MHFYFVIVLRGITNSGALPGIVLFFYKNSFTRKVTKIIKKFLFHCLRDDYALRNSILTFDCPIFLTPLAAVKNGWLFSSNSHFWDWEISTHIYISNGKGMFLAVDIFWNPWYFSVGKIYWLPFKAQKSPKYNFITIAGCYRKFEIPI